MGAEVRVYDPVAMDACRNQHPELEVTYAESLLDLATKSDALVLVTEWEEFKRANWNEIGSVMRWPLVIDGRNSLPEEDVKLAGFTYRGIGR